MLWSLTLNDYNSDLINAGKETVTLLPGASLFGKMLCFAKHTHLSTSIYRFQ